MTAWYDYGVAYDQQGINHTRYFTFLLKFNKI